MSERDPNKLEAAEKEQRKREYIALGEELSARPEAFRFPGIEPESYAKMKATEDGFATPIDELLQRLQNEGFKVVCGTHRGSGNIFIMPSGSDNIDEDSLLPRHLVVSDDMDETLKRFILAGKEWFR